MLFHLLVTTHFERIKVLNFIFSSFVQVENFTLFCVVIYSLR